MDLPSVDIIAVNYNGALFLKDFFDSLTHIDYPKEKMRLFFVDNGSSDGSLDFVASLKVDFTMEIVRNGRNYGYARANNLTFPKCTAPYIGLINCDTRPDSKWLAALTATMEADPSIGMACSRQVPEESPRAIDPVTGETSWCSGGHCLIRRSALEKVGYFDDHFFIYGEDVDLSWRMWLEGFRCVYVSGSVCEHHYGREEGYLVRRLYYHVRNSMLLRYAYGSPADVARAWKRWTWEALSLGVKRRRYKEAMAVGAAVIAHVAGIPHFLVKGRALRAKAAFTSVRGKWIHL